MANVRGRIAAADREDSGNFVFEEFVPSAAWTEVPSFHCLLVDLPGFKKEWLKIQVDERGHVFVSGEKPVSENKIVHFEQTFKLPHNSGREKITGKYEGETLYVVVPKQVKEEEERGKGTATGVEEKHERAKEEENQHEDGLPKQVKEEEERGTGTATGVEEKHERAKEEENQHEDGHSYSHGTDENTRVAGQEEGFHDAIGWETWRRQEEEEAGPLGGVVEMLSKNKGIVITVVLAFSLGVLLSQKFQSNAGIGTELQSR